MTQYERISNLATPSQEWARRHGACSEGRMALGTRTIGEFFNDPRSKPEFLTWIARKLANSVDEALQVTYSLEVGNAYTAGRWGTRHTRARLIELFHKYNVSIPARLL